ncbi:MAG: septal ring lytic transglycosylase RlpA family protein, partial [Phenylobacterium sp.]|nr:septal ring lytic transglycosylase RlpA family protein [Phenylobacterium sp.]
MQSSRALGASARLSLVLLAGASLAACATMEPRYPSRATGAQAGLPAGAGGERKIGKPYQVGGIWYVPREQPDYDQVGVASWYGDAFHLKATANGETFDMNTVSAAHTTLPLPSMVEVTNLDNGRKLVVRVNDRGPFVDNRIIDLSREAARQLGMDRAGLANVRVRYVGPAPLLGPADGYRVADGRSLPTRLASNGFAPAAATAA